MSQHQAWEHEYQKERGGIASTNRSRPSSAVELFAEYAEGLLNQESMRLLDLGCGTGKNSLYLAEQGFDVTAVDFSQAALEKFRQEAIARDIKNLNLLRADITSLPFANGSFDIATDITASTSLAPDQLPGFAAETYRVIRNGGYFLTYVLDKEDGVRKTLAPDSPSVTAEESGITDYYISEDKLRDLYQDWNILEMNKITKPGLFYGHEYRRVLWWMLLQKSSSAP